MAARTALSRETPSIRRVRHVSCVAIPAPFTVNLPSSAGSSPRNPGSRSSMGRCPRTGDHRLRSEQAPSGQRVKEDLVPHQPFEATSSELSSSNAWRTGRATRCLTPVSTLRLCRKALAQCSTSAGIHRAIRPLWS